MYKGGKTYTGGEKNESAGVAPRSSLSLSLCSGFPFSVIYTGGALTEKYRGRKEPAAWPRNEINKFADRGGTRSVQRTRIG